MRPIDAFEAKVHEVMRTKRIPYAQAHAYCTLVYRTLYNDALAEDQRNRAEAALAQQREWQATARRLGIGAQSRSGSIGHIGMANEISPSGELIQLSPKGDFPHNASRLQRVDQASIQSLIENLHALQAEEGPNFKGLPIFVGHPDVPGSSAEYPDKQEYGRIVGLEASPNGIYARAKWNNAGRVLVQNAHYKFVSPYWLAADVGVQDGKSVFRPESLISVGLTNNPRIPGLPLRN